MLNSGTIKLALDSPVYELPSREDVQKCVVTKDVVQKMAAPTLVPRAEEPPAKVRLHGKGDKWRVCPLWDETVKHLQWLLSEQSMAPNEPVFCARRSVPLTRFGIYKIVRRHAAAWDTSGPQPRHVTPHLFRHTAAVHLLESGIEVNVIRGSATSVSIRRTATPN